MTHKSKEIAKQMSACGAKFIPYARLPKTAQGLKFVLQREGNSSIRVYCDSSVDLTLYVDKKNKQVLAIAHEKATVIPHTTTLRFGGKTTNTYIRKYITNLDNLVTTPKIPGTKIKIIDMKKEEVKSTYADLYQEIGFKLELNIPSRKTILLAGIDESAHFVSMLPSTAKVKTVKEAHAFLRPKGLSNKAVRQGEFFFDPVPDNKVADQVLKLMSRNDYRLTVNYPLENRSTHTATVLAWKQTRNFQMTDPKYAFGQVIDTRDGRHKPLILKTWHRVVRNNEVVQENATLYD